MHALLMVLLFVVGMFFGIITTLFFLWYWSKREQRQFNRALKDLLAYAKEAPRTPEKKETASKRITEPQNKLN
jgi:Flp pilus assembly protein TadB